MSEPLVPDEKLDRIRSAEKDSPSRTYINAVDEAAEEIHAELVDRVRDITILEGSLAENRQKLANARKGTSVGSEDIDSLEKEVAFLSTELADANQAYKNTIVAAKRRLQAIPYTGLANQRAENILWDVLFQWTLQHLWSRDGSPIRPRLPEPRTAASPTPLPIAPPISRTPPAAVPEPSPVPLPTPPAPTPTPITRLDAMFPIDSLLATSDYGGRVDTGHAFGSSGILRTRQPPSGIEAFVAPPISPSLFEGNQKPAEFEITLPRDRIAAQAFDAYADAIDHAMETGELSAEELGKAMQGIAKDTVRSVGQQAASKGAVHVAQGIAMLASGGGDAARAEFRTGAKYFAVAALAGIGSGAIAAAGGSAGGGRRGDASGETPGSSVRRVVQNITVLGVDDPDVREAIARDLKAGIQ